MTAQVTVGLDGSEECLAAVGWAASEAVLREVPLRLVHVEEWPNTRRCPCRTPAPWPSGPRGCCGTRRTACGRTIPASTY
jgi:hypothetical protein